MTYIENIRKTIELKKERVNQLINSPQDYLIDLGIDGYTETKIPKKPEISKLINDLRVLENEFDYLTSILSNDELDAINLVIDKALNKDLSEHLKDKLVSAKYKLNNATKLLKIV
jgi:hypothetical protein